MKKFSFALLALLAFSFSMKAQQFVSTQPSNRNVILEEFTGRNCTWCPDGHLIANQIAANNPGRFWAINVHAGGYAPTTYPNMVTPDGNAIHGGFQISGYPTGVVNRSTAAGQSRSAWANLANQQFNQQSECNVAGMAVINPVNRMATIIVEVYYTGNSAYNENYLTVAMLQDSILGSQSGMSGNPAQVIGNQYCHMHVLRDVINTSAWGDVISPTTQGTLITRTYEYQIPESIGTPNGVAVDLDNIFFLAWVSERQQGAATRPILTGNKLDMGIGSNEPIFPYIRTVAQQQNVVCSHSKVVEATVQNGGTGTLTSMVLEATVDGQTFTSNWEGSLTPGSIETIEIPVEVPFGTFNVRTVITQANGQPFDADKTGTINCYEWSDLTISGEEENLRLELVQDKFGNQITWECVASDGAVLASGGPYSMLVGSNTTQIHVERILVPADECVQFTIRDSGNNGICCSNGQGYFIMKDSQGNVVFGDTNNGDFGSEYSHQISIQASTGAVVEVGNTEVTITDYTAADFMCPLETNMYPDQVGFVYKKLTNPQEFTVIGFFNEFQKILASVDDLEPMVMYSVKAFAVVDGETYYGAENHFFMSYESVNELESSLKLYPNPTANVLNIEGEGLTSVEVYNTVGQCIMMLEVNGDKVQVNTESLNAGMYFVRIHANDGSVLNRTFSVAR